ncbi:hypothetical protein GGR54DRAFT_637462 [Hypoxylon sp. NC1633]|nr:hypothetical protein GGR54DRAFT_637462 [Hypoxylon sp. NC1633]
MASLDNSNQHGDEAMFITLISQPSDSHLNPSFPKRQFVLSRQTPSVRIGRASKVPTKGFVASADNAWFDSPVMSRDHAELILDLDRMPKAVLIQDVGSLHGTFHIPIDGTGAESRLEKQKPVQLSSGDLLRFGTGILRAAETFPPYTVEFKMKIQEQEHVVDDHALLNAVQSTNRVFTIPDDDMDDEDDEDDDSVIETSMPPSYNAGSQSGHSIDLTGDDSNSVGVRNYHSNTTVRNTNSDVIDLTSEPDQDLNPEPTATGPRSPPFLAPLDTTIPTHPAGDVDVDVPTSFDHPQESTALPILHVEPGQRSDEGEFHLPSHLPLHLHFEDDSEMDSEDIRSTESEDDSIVTSDSVDDSSVDDDEDLDDNVSQSTHDYLRSESWQEDHESSDIELPYLDDDDSSSSYEEPDLESSPSPSVHDSSLSSSPNMPASKDPASEKAPVEPTQAPPPFTMPFLFTAAAQSQYDVPTAQLREPSPSDAAMFRSRPVQVLDKTPNDSRAQALGEASGKYEYFAARESNRTIGADQLPPPPISAIRETLGDNSDLHNTGAAKDHIPTSPASPVGVDAPPAKLVEDPVVTSSTASFPIAHIPNIVLNYPDETQNTQDSTWSVHGENFIKDPRSIKDLPVSYPERGPSPELDMTSAYAFQLSKKSNATQSHRRVEIRDLLMGEPGTSQASAHTVHLPPIAAPVQDLANAASCMQNSIDSAKWAVGPVGDSPEKASDTQNLKRSFGVAFTDEDGLEMGMGVLEGPESPPHRGLNEESNSDSANRQDHGATAVTPSEDVPRRELYVPDVSPGVQPIPVPSRPDYFQPSKRRRFTQAAACVALGGAAVFTFMVSTAPVL